MVELGIRPFRPEDVAQYKAAMTNPPKGKIEVAILIIFALSAAVMVISLLAGVICNYVGVVDYGSLPWILLGSLVVVIVSIICEAIRSEILGVPVMEWATIPIDRCESLVPEFALQTAVDLNALCPEAEFFIEELRQRESRHIVHDPFLVVQDSAGNTYHLEVWNEPGFEKKREY